MAATNSSPDTIATRSRCAAADFPTSRRRRENGTVGTFIPAFLPRGAGAGFCSIFRCRPATATWMKSRCCPAFGRVHFLRGILWLRLRETLLPTTVHLAILTEEQNLIR